MRVLVLGATGMLGNAMFRVLSEESKLSVFGTVRTESSKAHFPVKDRDRLFHGVDVENHDSLVSVFGLISPDVVVNCVGLVKQLDDANNPLMAVPINSLLPHRLAALCRVAKARLIHISTDCVFSGEKGNYIEDDRPDADDLYGRTKLLGEVDYQNAVTLRTSIIGHELGGSRSLINWFLAQEASIKGFAKAIFSGLPTVELASIVKDFVIPQPGLRGLYHVSSKPISKLDLLMLVREIYGKDIEIVPDENFSIDRSLDSSRFKAATGYVAPEWSDLVKKMHDFR